MLNGSLCVCVCVGALLAAVSAYPGQVAETACKDMTPKGPGHNEAKPQRTPLPKEFTTTVDANKIRSGDSVVVTLEATGPASIAGCMVQCRASKSDNPLGTFTPKSANGKTISCSSDDDTGSHNDPAPKKRIVFTWTPTPGFKGVVDCFATLAKTKTVFWVKQKVATITVV